MRQGIVALAFVALAFAGCTEAETESEHSNFGFGGEYSGNLAPEDKAALESIAQEHAGTIEFYEFGEVWVMSGMTKSECNKAYAAATQVETAAILDENCVDQTVSID